jgi:hypothetical protein
MSVPRSVVGIHPGRGGSKMGELLHFPDEVESQSDGRWQGRLAASETVDSIIGLTNTLGACLEGLLSNLWRLEEASLERDGFRLNRLRIPESDRF